MWIILEGADGAGKSTIAELIQQKLRRPIMTHMGPPKIPDQFSALAECVDDKPFGTYRPGKGEHIVSDRHHLGGPVYGPLYRPETNLDDHGDIGIGGFRYAELFVASRGGATILVSVPPEVARDRVLKRGDDYIKTADIELICDRYVALLPEVITFKTRMHYLRGAYLDAWIERAVEMAAKAEREVWKLQDFPTYIGTPWPEKLVIYDGSRRSAVTLLDATPSSEWWRIGLVHSLTKRRLKKLTSILCDPQVIDLSQTGTDIDTDPDDHGARG